LLFVTLFVMSQKLHGCETCFAQDVKKLVQSAQELNTFFTKMSTGVALQVTCRDA
jgi:hypothetical protein